VIQRAGVGDDEPHRSSEPKTPRVIPVVIQLVERGRGEQAMSLEEGVQYLSCPEAQQTTQFRMCEAPRPETPRRQVPPARGAASAVAYKGGKARFAPCPPYRARRNGGHTIGCARSRGPMALPTLQLMSVRQGAHKGRPYIVPIA
jgi:hypothetical protein